MSPLTIHVKLNAVSGQVRGAAVNCPVTSPEENEAMTTVS